MRLALWLLCLAAAIAATHRVTAQDADEFEGVEAPTVAVPESTAGKTPDLPELPPLSASDFYLEMGSLAFAALYVLNFFLGKFTQRKIANQWLEKFDPYLVKEFAYTGASTEPKVGLLEESTNNFKYYCTGRRFCSRLVADLQMIPRHDLFMRLWSLVAPSNDYLTFDVGLNATDLDPIVLAVTKKTQYNALVKEFPELISISKRYDTSDVPASCCYVSDNIEIPKTAFTKTMQNHITKLEPFLEYFIITDVSAVSILGFPKSESRVLRLRFKLRNGSCELDPAAAVSFVAFLIDAVGSTLKLPRDLKLSAQKKRAKYVQERLAGDSTQAAQARRMIDIKDKKRQEYENLSYEDQQKLDALQQNRKLRKRVGKVRT